MEQESHGYSFPRDGKILMPGDTYLLKMDKRNKGAKSNFDHFISILDKKEGKSKSPVEFYIYKLAGICNQYGIDKDCACDLICERFKNHKEIRTQFKTQYDFYQKLRLIADSVYGQFKSAYGTWQNETEEEEKEETPT
ncbi:hypothetical protein, partial [Niastella populi]|uniref:hypothetical protein n=1 Tax=Niastella populi TaxID=550983 RepID=UPI001056DB9E